MIAALKSELRKLLTVRSTYIIVLLSLVLEVFFAFYATAYHASLGDAQNPRLLAGEATDAISVLATLGALVGVLLVTHEYRYNTIVYTLSSSRSRSRVLFAKLIAISCFAIVFAAVASMLAPVLAALGWHVRGVQIVHQDFHVWNLLWRTVLVGWGFAMFALILAFIIRIQVGAIAALFLIPGTVEQLLGLLLKTNQVYLPFSSLNAVINPTNKLSATHAAIVAAVYVIGGWFVAWLLFLRRDAN